MADADALRDPNRISLGNVLLSLTVLVVFVLCIEGGVRVWGRVSSGKTSRIFHGIIRHSGLMEEDEARYWRFKPNLNLASHEWVHGPLRTNRFGFRGPDVVIPKPIGVRRVICLGDSSTFGWAVAEEDTFAARLGRALGPSWEVINAGIPGYSSLQGRRAFNSDIMKFEPDVIIVAYGWNDLKLATDHVPDRDRRVLTSRQMFWHRLLLRSQTLTWLRAIRIREEHATHAEKAGVPRSVSRTEPQELRENLARIVDRAQQLQIYPILMTEAVGPLDDVATVGVNASALAAVHARYMAVVRNLAQEWDIPFVDADAALSGHADYFDLLPADFMHFNAAGHGVIAEQLIAIDVFRHQERAQTSRRLPASCVGSPLPA